MNSLYAYMNGDRIVAIRSDDQTIPMVYTDEQMALSMKPQVEEYAKQTGQEIILERWDNPSKVLRIKP